jgi:hypothetical protein
MKGDRFKQLPRLGMVTVLLILQGAPAAAGSINPPAALWNQGPAPFVALFTCKNQLSAHFPNTADQIENELVQAAEEWFVGSGADIRLYYFGSLTPDNPACADVPTVINPRIKGAPPDGPQPPRWSVVLTAASSLTNRFSFPGVERCHFAVTDRWEIPASVSQLPPTPGIERARITLVRGQTCSGALEPWPWFDPMGPLPQTLSTSRVLMKMLGHAMGLSEETGSADTVMAPIDPNAPDDRWHLSEPIVRAMRTAYGPARSSPYWIETKDAGKTWTTLTGTPRYNSRNSLGLAGCQARSPEGRAKAAYLLAETILNPDGTSGVISYFVDAGRRHATHPQHHGSSNRKPTLVCGDGLYLLGMVKPAGEIQIRRSTDGIVWADATLPPGWQSAHAPALAEAKWANGILAATSTTQTGLRFLLSANAGASFAAASSSMASPWRPRFPFGLTCPSAKRRCYLAFGDYGFSLLAEEVQGANIVGVRWSGGGEIPNLGTLLAPTKDRLGYFLVRRYKPGSRYYATPNTALDQVAGGLQPDAEKTPWEFTMQPFSRTVSDSPVGLFRDDIHGSFVVLSTWNNWYNGYGYTVLKE